MKVSDHIIKFADDVRLYGSVREIEILGVPHRALKAYTGKNKEYVVSVIRGKWNWSSCSCLGYKYVSICKHIFVGNQYLDKLEKEERK